MTHGLRSDRATWDNAEEDRKEEVPPPRVVTQLRKGKEGRADRFPTRGHG